MKLNSVTIKNMDKVGQSTFLNCVGLQTANLPQATIFEKNSFFNCKSLSTLTILESDIQVNEYAFSGCSLLTSFPFENTKSIGIGSFSFCSSLVVGESVPLFGAMSSFANCNSLTQITVTSKDNFPIYMFENCVGLTKVTFTDESTNVFGFMFAGCTSLEEVDLNKVTAIDNFAFQNTKLTNLDLKIVKTIGLKSFLNCGIQKITIRTDITQIDQTSFQGCSQLSQIIIEDGVTKFDMFGFEDSSPVTFTINNQNFNYNDNILMQGTNTILYYGKDDTKYTVPAEIEKIGKCAFCHSKITEITCDKEITFPYGFSGLKTLVTVTFTGVNTIPDYAFYNCINLETIEFPSTTKNIGNYAFCNCKKLENINLETAGDIGEHSFENCSSLTSIKCESSTIMAYAFYNCKSLKNVEFKSQYINLGMYSFSRTGIENITLPSGQFEDGVFSYAEKLQFLNYSGTDGLNIPSYMFEHTSLVGIYLKITRIGKFSFSFIKSLRLFVIIDECEVIDPESFYGSENVQFRFTSCIHPKFLLGNHELVDKDT